MAKVLSGERPERPNHPVLTDNLWVLVQRCWQKDPRRRPEIGDIVLHLQIALATQRGRACPGRENFLLSHTSAATMANAPKNGNYLRLFPRLRRHAELGKALSEPKNAQSTLSNSVFEKSRKGLRRMLNGAIPCSFLQRAHIWLLGCGDPSAPNARHAIPVQLGGKRPEGQSLEHVKQTHNLTITIRKESRRRHFPGDLINFQCPHTIDRGLGITPSSLGLALELFASS